MKNSKAAPFLFYALSTLSGLAAEVYTSGHFDLSITYEPEQGGWVTKVYDYGNDAILSTDDVIMEIGDEGKLTIPSGRPWELIGDAGDDAWVLPEVYDADLIYLGVGTQRMARGIFTGGLSNRGRINMGLVALEGSGVEAGGTLTMWQAGFPPVVYFASGDGINEQDMLEDIPAGAHSHYNWAFSQPGDYFVTFEVSGELTDTYGGGYTSTQVTYHFRVTDGLPGFLESVDVGNDWRRSDSLGYFNPTNYPWVYFQEQGWWYLTDATEDASFIWDRQLNWLWTSTSGYPFLYSFEREEWLYFGKAEDGGRWFNSPSTGWFWLADL